MREYVVTMKYDPTAQSEWLTPGQKIVAEHESDMISEPCELADLIDRVLAEEMNRMIDVAAGICSTPQYHALIRRLENT
jgi:hypothetical protein